MQKPKEEEESIVWSIQIVMASTTEEDSWQNRKETSKLLEQWILINLSLPLRKFGFSVK